MDRIYRIKQGMGGRPAIERDGQLHWLKGELFGGINWASPSRRDHIVFSRR
jgi:hypothetical protein